ncbi:MAG: SagB/ThcOx family dehydrogenase [bacterium]
MKVPLHSFRAALAVALLAAAGAAQAGEAVPPLEMLTVRLLTMSKTELRALSIAVADNDRNDDFVTVTGALGGPARDTLLGRAGARGAAQMRAAIEEAGPKSAAEVDAAVARMTGLLEPDFFALYLGYALYAEEEYRAAAEQFERALAAAPGKREQYYQAACAWALAGDKEAAFKNLDRAVGAGWSSARDTREDKDLDSLHPDPRWEAVLAKMDAAAARRDAALPDSLVALKVVKLPEPARAGKVTVEEALWQRQSVRRYGPGPLTLAEVGQLCFAAYGVNRPVEGAPSSLGGGLKTAPSAGACYPLEVYVVAGNVTGLEPGVYLYRTDKHELWLVGRGDKRTELAAAALGQKFIGEAPASLVWSAVFERNTKRYGARGRERYVCMDVGHSGENVCLQAPALGLGTVAVGAFTDAEVKAVVGMTKPEEPLYIMPVGRLTAPKQ